VINDNLKIRLLKEAYRHLPLVVLVPVALFVTWLNTTPIPSQPKSQQSLSALPFLSISEYNYFEKKIADHFTADTLPGLLQKGFIRKYRRDASGTCISVNGNLWKKRSTFFKQNLLAEILVHNKVHGYELSTWIVDSVSGRLYAQISSSAKTDFYD
jgi:hypothetical protein